MSLHALRNTVRRLVMAVAAIAVVSGGLSAVNVATDAQPAAAADLTTFQAGNIISDSLFWDSNAMTVSQIQDFLNSKVTTCQAGYTCLKDYRETTWTSTANPMCASYVGAANETAATIIYKVAKACGVSQKVILVMLQKEQGLVTNNWPSDWRYQAAMGAGCPDTAACDSEYYGFYNQVRYGAYLLKRYTQPPGTGAGTWWDSRYDLMKPVGQVVQIQYHPNIDCGTQDVYMANQATHSLYLYTPYTPNPAALAAGYGYGDDCSAYGNRNFFNYYTDWFGSTQASPPVVSTNPAISGTPRIGATLTAGNGTYTGTAISSYSYLWARCTATKAATTTLPGTCSTVSTATGRTYVPEAADLGKFLTVRVTATNSAGSAAIWSTTTGAVGELPAFTVAPVVSGASTAGAAASVTSGTWTGTPPPTLAYTWYVCPAAVPASGPSTLSTCATAGSTTNSITWTAAQVGKFGAVRVVATNTAGSTTTWASLPTAIAAAPVSTPTATATPTPTVTPTVTPTPSATPTPTPSSPPAPAEDPYITGTAAVGSTLSVNPATWAGASVLQNYGPTYNGYYVRNIQTALNLANIATTVDGDYGPQTAANVRTFQAANGLTADGIAGPMTYAVMSRLLTDAATMTYAWMTCTAASAASNTPPTACVAIPGATTVNYVPVSSDANSFITAKVVGSKNGVTTTMYAATVGAVTGSSTPVVAPTTTPTPTATPTPVATPTPTVTPTVTPTTTSTPTPTPTTDPTQPALSGTAKVGQILSVSTGNWTPVNPYQNFGPTYNTYYVRNIQLALKSSGISVAVDGIYGSATRTAVRTFQSKKSLSVDGVVGPQTWSLMNSVLASQVKFSYKWYSCTASVSTSTAIVPANCKAITGAAASTYRPVALDATKFITVAVTGMNAGKQSTVLVPSTSAIAP